MYFVPPKRDVASCLEPTKESLSNLFLAFRKRRTFFFRDGLTVAAARVGVTCPCPQLPVPYRTLLSFRNDVTALLSGSLRWAGGIGRVKSLDTDVRAATRFVSFVKSARPP